MVTNTYSPATGITEEQADASVLYNVNRIGKEAKDRMDHLIWEEIPRAINCTGTPVQKHRKVIEIISEVSSIISPVLPCKDGCSHCCYQAVTVTTHEANMIQVYTGVKHKNVTSNITEENVKAVQDKYRGEKCPFLVDNRCSVYEVRPVACRTHFNLSSYPELCDVKNINGKIPSLNFQTAWYGMSAIHFETSFFEDIRVFYPEGLNTKA